MTYALLEQHLRAWDETLSYHQECLIVIASKARFLSKRRINGVIDNISAARKQISTAQQALAGPNCPLTPQEAGALLERMAEVGAGVAEVERIARDIEDVEKGWNLLLLALEGRDMSARN